jgi:DNA-binding transcriptional ArsR family regulator
MTLYDEMKIKIGEITHSQFTIRLLDTIFQKPIFKTTDFVKMTKISKPTVMGLLRQLKENNILIELQQGSGSRAAILCFPKLLNISEGRKNL